MLDDRFIPEQGNLVNSVCIVEGYIMGGRKCK